MNRKNVSNVLFRWYTVSWCISKANKNSAWLGRYVTAVSHCALHSVTTDSLYAEHSIKQHIRAIQYSQCNNEELTLHSCHRHTAEHRVTNIQSPQYKLSTEWHSLLGNMYAANVLLLYGFNSVYSSYCSGFFTLFTLCYTVFAPVSIYYYRIDCKLCVLFVWHELYIYCLLYTSDAADE